MPAPVIGPFIPTGEPVERILDSDVVQAPDFTVNCIWMDDDSGDGNGLSDWLSSYGLTLTSTKDSYTASVGDLICDIGVARVYRILTATTCEEVAVLSTSGGEIIKSSAPTQGFFPNQVVIWDGAICVPFQAGKDRPTMKPSLPHAFTKRPVMQ